METYKPIHGFEGIYEVSDLGNVRSVPRLRRSRGFKYAVGYRVLKGAVTRDGYKTVRLYHHVGGTKWTDASVHRLVASAFLPQPEGKLFVNHKDGNKLNNSPANLEWCTRSENCRHAISIGLVKPKRGEDHGMVILKSAEVEEIRKILSEGKLSQREIGLMYKVSRGCIRDIKIGKSWALKSQ